MILTLIEKVIRTLIFSFSPLWEVKLLDNDTVS